MADDKDDSEKTEEPTHKRLEDAQKRGQVFQSREINSLMLFFTFAIILAWAMNGIFHDMGRFMLPFIERPDALPADNGLSDVLRSSIANVAITFAPMMLAFVVAALFAGMAQKPLVFSAESIQPKLEKISPIKGLGRMFSLKSLSEFLKGIFKITVIAVIVFLVVWPQQDELTRLPDTEPEALLHFLKSLALQVLIGVVIAMFFIALIDYFYQRYEYMKNLRMSKQDIKDEYKQQEGDPVVKQRLRQIRMERAQKRMMSNVPEADVVITNPTHYAVALKYDSLRMQAPQIVAKGKDKVAFRIREMAEKFDVPIVENPPLARALFPVELEEEVPLEHYQAVAEVISYVYKLKGHKL